LSTTTDKGRIEHLLIYKFPLPSPPAWQQDVGLSPMIDLIFVEVPPCRA
jgi:hypothetical protein